MKKVLLYGGTVELLFNEKEHYYEVNGIKPPGVTSVIKETLGTSMAIAQWMANQAGDYILNAVDWDSHTPNKKWMEALCKKAKLAHRTTSKDATDTGKQAHEYAEKVFRGLKPDLPTDEKARKAAQAFNQWKDSSHLEPIEVERMVFSRKHFYAGTTDFYGLVNGRLTVADLKTSSGLYREMPLQLAAYAVALEEEFGEKIEDGWIVRLCKKTGNCEPYHITLTDQLKNDWLLVRATYKALGRTEKVVEESREWATM